MITLNIDNKPVALEDKRAILGLMDTMTPGENRRLDGVEAFAAAYEVFVRAYDSQKHSEALTKPFIREHGTDEFLKIKNLKAMCWAFDWLRENYSR